MLFPQHAHGAGSPQLWKPFHLSTAGEARKALDKRSLRGPWVSEPCRGAAFMMADDANGPCFDFKVTLWKAKSNGASCAQDKPSITCGKRVPCKHTITYRRVSARGSEHRRNEGTGREARWNDQGLEDNSKNGVTTHFDQGVQCSSAMDETASTEIQPQRLPTSTVGDNIAHLGEARTVAQPIRSKARDPCGLPQEMKL